MDSFPDLGQRVRTHLCYAQVFRDALRRSELVARCDPANPNLVERELNLLRAEGAIERVGDYWFLRGHGVPDWSTVKRTRERLTRDILDANRSLLGLLRRLPMVRLLAVSGSLARGHAVPNGEKPPDLDLFIVTSPSGVHIVRLIVHVTRTINSLLAALRPSARRPLPCLNYTTENNLSGDHQSVVLYGQRCTPCEGAQGRAGIPAFSCGQFLDHPLLPHRLGCSRLRCPQLRYHFLC